MKKLVPLLVVLLLACACSGNKESLEISGSTSVAPVMEKLIAAYQKDHAEEINLTADGSSAGINAATEGVSDIGMSSRVLKPEELKDDLDVQAIGIDAVVVVVNKDNNVKNLTIEDLHDIYTGKKTNWQDFGGSNRPITIISREDGSGTRDAFEEAIEARDANGVSLVDKNNPVIVNSTGAVIENVKQKADAIGYMSLGSVNQDVKALSLNSVEPTTANIKAKKYPITRDFYLIYKKDNTNAQDFVTYILSPAGQQIMVDAGFLNIK